MRNAINWNHQTYMFLCDSTMAFTSPASTKLSSMAVTLLSQSLTVLSSTASSADWLSSESISELGSGESQTWRMEGPEALTNANVHRQPPDGAVTPRPAAPSDGRIRKPLEPGTPPLWASLPDAGCCPSPFGGALAAAESRAGVLPSLKGVSTQRRRLVTTGWWGCGLMG